MTEAVSWSDDGPVLSIVLNRPPANALGPAITDGLHAALDEADASAPKVLIVSSELTGFFAAGADIKHMTNVDAASFKAYGDGLRSGLDRLAAHPALSIAAIEGLALGGGLELAMACTLRVAAADAKLGLPEVKLGLIPGAGGTQRLPRLVGRGPALDIMLTGRQLDAAEALRIGLIDRLTPAGSAVGVARELATELCAASTPAQRAVVRTVGAASDLPLAEGLRYEVEQIQALFEHGEAAEGLRAFVEKRRPNFA
ncbi:enoyl-CoA hydratase-related protein [Mycobacterium sp. CVI_P3]|uniref:Enoyl-CoA hydratase-related protein n=1 Tax=Mycobacterium pinniadriaticum TaxID=2994102 RepID=A0ABT3SH12_9MYCO|nr:enoyl-CoA hydratase-related protein [Mycobacterium pinniadriaticum]MCX2932357.1 enoyl-CoA hydratase-related protein [Mycobacterium pinniadriaticum]MCX2938786.1 enoyl-CoA hydratase-related protein [Mycobacterium pinniadriaticum]